MDIIVTYDIATPDRAGQRRLARIAAVCERYGVRVQYSVFECRLDGIILERLISELQATMNSSQDSIKIYRLAGPAEDLRISLGRSGHDWGDALIL